MVNGTPRPLYPRLKTRYSLYWRLGWTQGRFGWLRKISPPTGIRSPDRPARTKSLYRLRYRGPSGDIAPLNLILDPRWGRISVWLPGRMISRCCLNRRLAEPYKQLGCLGDARDLILSPGTEPRFLGSPLRSPVTIRLQYRFSVVTRSSTHFQVFFLRVHMQHSKLVNRHSEPPEIWTLFSWTPSNTSASRPNGYPARWDAGLFRDCSESCCHVSNQINPDVKGRTGWMQAPYVMDQCCWVVNTAVKMWMVPIYEKFAPLARR